MKFPDPDSCKCDQHKITVAFKIPCNDISLPKTDLNESPSAQCAGALAINSSFSTIGSAVKALNIVPLPLRAALRQDELSSFAHKVGTIANGSESRERRSVSHSYQNPEWTPMRPWQDAPMGLSENFAIEMLEGRSIDFQLAGGIYHCQLQVLWGACTPTDHWVRAYQRLDLTADERKISAFSVCIGRSPQPVSLSRVTIHPATEFSGFQRHKLFHWPSQGMERISQSPPGTSDSPAATVKGCSQ